MKQIKSILLAGIFMVSGGVMADRSWDVGDTWVGTEYSSNQPKEGTYTWPEGDTYTGTYIDDYDKFSAGEAYLDGLYIFPSGTQYKYTNGVESVWTQPWDTDTGYNWDEITEDPEDTKEMKEYAEMVRPGITDLVDFKAGNVDEDACDCGGWYQGRTFDGVDKHRIVLNSYHWDSGYIGGSYDWGFGYVPLGMHGVMHEIAHYDDFMENRHKAGIHGDRFKHFLQEMIEGKNFMETREEGYEYGNGDVMYDRDVDY